MKSLNKEQDGKENVFKKPRVIVHFDTDGQLSYMVEKGARCIIIDERAADDRVYEYTTHARSRIITALIGNSTVHSKHDEKHPGIVARVRELVTGTPRLTVVKPGDDRG